MVRQISLRSEGDRGLSKMVAQLGSSEAPHFWLHAGELGWVG